MVIEEMARIIHNGRWTIDFYKGAEENPYRVILTQQILNRGLGVVETIRKEKGQFPSLKAAMQYVTYMIDRRETA